MVEVRARGLFTQETICVPRAHSQFLLPSPWVRLNGRHTVTRPSQNPSLLTRQVQLRDQLHPVTPSPQHDLSMNSTPVDDNPLRQWGLISSSPQPA